MSGESIHMARPSSETSMTGASPVVARCRRPAAIPAGDGHTPGQVAEGRPPTDGPFAVGRGEGVGHAARDPSRRQPSYPPFSRSGPSGPWPEPRAYTMPGLTARMCSTSIFSRWRTGGRKLVRNTSDVSASL